MDVDEKSNSIVLSYPSELIVLIVCFHDFSSDYKY